MKAYKLKQQLNRIEKGRIFYKVNSEMMLLATPTKPQEFFSNYAFSQIQNQGLIDEVELEDEKWVHPHLYKPIKQELLKLN